MQEQNPTTLLSQLEHELASSASAQERRRLLELLLAPSRPPRMTYEAFLDWADEDTLAEWIAIPGSEKGEVLMMSPASNRHQDISDFMTSVLRVYIQARNLGTLRSAPFQMKLTHGREPDLLFIHQAHLARLKATFVEGPADLVIEIISPESAGRDRGEKYYEYAQGGVPEYWLIDPQTEWAEFYQLEEGRYRLILEGRTGKYHARELPGFWLQVEWLWQHPLPSPIRTLAEIVDMDPALIEAFESALRGN